MGNCVRLRLKNENESAYKESYFVKIVVPLFKEVHLNFINSKQTNVVGKKTLTSRNPVKAGPLCMVLCLHDVVLCQNSRLLATKAVQNQVSELMEAETGDGSATVASKI